MVCTVNDFQYKFSYKNIFENEKSAFSKNPVDNEYFISQ